MTTKKTEEEEEEPNPGGGGGGGGGSTSILPDRISELPKEILVHILGLLEMDELLIRTSLVSTKWRNLWKSVSTLKFIRLMCSFGDEDDVEKIYHSFIDHVLRLRDSQSSSIRIFRYLFWNNSPKLGFDYLETLHNFILSAVNQGAQEIIMGGFYGGPIPIGDPNMMIIHFNPSIFTSGGEQQQLRKFTFRVDNIDNRHRFLVQFPEGDAATAQLHLVCPLLETLDMSSCYYKHLEVLDISAPRLITLSINNSWMGNGDFDFLGGCRIEIRTPNLTSLDYSGRVYVDCFTENLPHIAVARLYFTEDTGMVEKTTSFAIKLLKGLTGAERLSLIGFEDFSQDTLKVLLTPFTSLRTLLLGSSCKISSIHGMVHILNSCNSIEKLVWQVDKFVEVEGDEHLMLPQCILSHLKHVHIRSLAGHENEIEFTKFLLKSSVVLDEIIIHSTPDSPKQSIEEKLKQFIEEELWFRSIQLCVIPSDPRKFEAI